MTQQLIPAKVLPFYNYYFLYATFKSPDHELEPVEHEQILRSAEQQNQTQQEITQLIESMKRLFETDPLDDKDYPQHPGSWE